MNEGAEEEAQRRVERTISRMADAMDRSSSSLTTSIKELRQEISELKEQRYKPYFTSVGLFVVITLAVTGYVYNLESRITGALFNLQKEISSNDADIRVAREMVEIHAERAMARQDHTKEREAAISARVDELKQGSSRIADELVHHLKEHRDAMGQ